MTYAFESTTNRWATLPDTFDLYQEELDAIERFDKETTDSFNIPAFDEYEVL